MKRYVQVFALAIAFDLYWTLVVLFRERGLIIWCVLAIFACLMLPPAHRVRFDPTRGCCRREYREKPTGACNHEERGKRKSNDQWIEACEFPDQWKRQTSDETRCLRHQ